MKNKLRVMTFNIQHGGFVNIDMQILARDIKELDPDIIGVQEIDIKTDRVFGRDTLKELADFIKIPYYKFCKAIDFENGEYGTAVLSKYPIKDFSVKNLPTGDTEGRSYSHSVIDINGIKTDFYNTHLSLFEDLRIKQLGIIAEEVNNKENFILTGDFNEDKIELFDVINYASLANPNKYFSFREGKVAIDNIFFSGKWKITDTGSVFCPHSDHDPVYADIEYTGD